MLLGWWGGTKLIMQGLNELKRCKSGLKLKLWKVISTSAVKCTLAVKYRINLHFTGSGTAEHRINGIVVQEFYSLYLHWLCPKTLLEMSCESLVKSVSHFIPHLY